MKLYFFLIYITIQIYKTQLCEQMNTCYNCLKSDNNNCSWSNNLCSSQSLELLVDNKNDNNSIKDINLSDRIINSQYKCMKNKNNIETFKELNNETIEFSFPSNYFQELNHLESINYHIFCFEYIYISNILLSINLNEKFKNNILHFSLFNNLTNSETIINLDSKDYKINIKSDYFCIKITFEINNQIKELISFHVEKINEYNEKNIKKNENLISYIILAGIILLITLILWAFIIFHRRTSGIMKEITIINKASLEQEQNSESNESPRNNSNNCDQSNCSKLQEKYLEMEHNSFVKYNFEDLNSFINNIHDIEKKNKYLKTIIKTMPSYIIGNNNRDLIGSYCSFCENKIKYDDNVCLLNCGHIFHYDCIYQQIITNEEYKCILCKENIII